MQTLVNQIEASLGAGFYYLSLIASLTVPDIAGAIDSENGEASGRKYADWYESWVRPRFAEIVLDRLPDKMRTLIPKVENPLSGEACYRFRCSLLHQGSSQPSGPFSRIMFIEPGATTNVLHYNTVNDALIIDVNLFCREIAAGATLWLKKIENSPRYNRNYERFARRHPNGLAPYIGGVPVIG